MRPSLKEFKLKIESMFFNVNPNATIIKWDKPPRFIQYPTGTRGIAGSFIAAQEGYKTQRMFADWDEETGWLIR